MRIFIGLTDVANITANYTKGFQALGHEVFSVVWSKSLFFPDSQYDLVIDDGAGSPSRWGRIGRYVKIVAGLFQLTKSLKCDLFILYAPAVLPVHLYYPLLKFFGKRIVTAFWGSDARYWYIFSEEMKDLGVYEAMAPFFEYARTRPGGSYWDKLRTVRTAEKYSDLILSQPDSAQLQSLPYMRTHVPLDLSEYDFLVPGRDVPLVLHAPSVPQAKGTDVVADVVRALKEEGLKFEYRLITNMPNNELRQLLTQSDIVVDELYSATVGVLSSEAMATGNVVLVHYLAEYCKVPPGCPAVNVDRFALKETLRHLILDVERRRELATLGRPYVERTNDHVRVCRQILWWLENGGKFVYDFSPSSGKSKTVPPDILNLERRETRKKRADFFKSLLSSGSPVDTPRKESH